MKANKQSPLYTPPATKRRKKAECTKDLDGAYRWNGRLDGGREGKAPGGKA